MGPFWILAIVLAVGTLFFAVYAMIRLPKRFREGDVEGYSAGGTQEWAKKYEDPPPPS